MDSRQLEYLIAVAEERNISHAATRLLMSQSALTRQIQVLEEELGVLLFLRGARGVELTTAGNRLLNHARTIHAIMAQAEIDVRSLSPGQIKRLDVGAFGAVVVNHVPVILDAFRETHPDVQIVIHNLPKEQQIEAVRQGRIQVSFDRFLPNLQDLCVDRVVSEPLLVALHQRNPLARKETIEFAELRNEPMITGASMPGVKAPLQTLSSHYGFEPVISQTANNYLSCISLVAGGFGCVLVPQSLQSLQFSNVVFRPLIADIEAVVDLFCLYLPNNPSLLLEDFLKAVRAYSREYGMRAQADQSG